MVEQNGRTAICSIVFLDVVAYSTVTDAMQVAIKSRLNGFISDAVERIAESERIILDTGDGVALCFLGDPEDALFVATSVKDASVEQAAAGREHTPVLRIGINLGPVKLVTDLNGRPNVLGDGINVAQRVMSFADHNEILVSRSYFEVVSRLRQGNEKLFSYLGVKKDKHVRSHQIYAFGLRSGDQSMATTAKTTTADGPLSPEVLDEARQRLANRIGPLAQIIVRRAAPGATTTKQLYEAIAVAIPDEADRAAFIQDAPADKKAPPAAPEKKKAGPGPPKKALTEADLAEATQRMAQVIGPLARILVRRAAGDAANKADLYQRLAENIDDAGERRRFLAMAED